MIIHSRVRPGPLALAAIALLAGCNSETEIKGTLSDDNDGDGYSVGNNDCDDNDPSIHPDAYDTCFDGLDADCDGFDGCDLDGDGYSADDCDDSDPAVHPGALEDCDTPEDDNCDGMATECRFAWMIYEPTAVGPIDSRSTVIVHDPADETDRVLFGDPSGGDASTELGEGRVVGFDLQQGVVTELDAAFTVAGPTDQDAALGYSLAANGFTSEVCMGADYYDPDATTSDGGKAWCFADTMFVNGTLPLSDAAYTVGGSLPGAFASASPALSDLDLDGNGDIRISTAYGLYLVDDPVGLSGDYVVPDDGLGPIAACDAPSRWCTFGNTTAYEAPGPTRLLVSGDGGPGDEISSWDSPVAASDPPLTSVLIDRSPDSPVVDTGLAIAVGDPDHDTVWFLTQDGLVTGAVRGTPGERFGAWISLSPSGGYLAIGAPSKVWDGLPVGGAYVFDSFGELYYNDWPVGMRDADFELIGPETHTSCGWQVDLSVREVGRQMVASVACPGSGGAAYVVIEADPPPAPPVLPAQITKTGQYAYSIKKSVVSSFWTNGTWLRSLAQTEAVENAAGAITGWRLHDIAVGSPLYRAGLRQGDIIDRVNNTPMPSSVVVTAVATTAVGAALVNPNYVATVRVRRQAAVLTFSYRAVP